MRYDIRSAEQESSMGAGAGAGAFRTKMAARREQREQFEFTYQCKVEYHLLRTEESKAEDKVWW